MNELAFRIAVDEPEPAKFTQAGTYDYYAHERTWGMVMDYSECVYVVRITSLPDFEHNFKLH